MRRKSSASRLDAVLMPSLLLVLLLGACAAPPQLRDQVTIRRTAYGVPHILGESEEAAAFGFGYAQAEDHLLNIMRQILRARGTLAKHFGGEENLRSDLWNRQFRVHARTVATYDRLDPDFRAVLEGFAAGLSYYVELHRDELPEWVGPISGQDIAAHGMTHVLRFAFNRGRIVERFLETAPTAEPHAAGSEPTGSNMLALAPERSRSGNAILMGNPHQAWSDLATYYEAHLTVPGKIDFYGSTFVGRPVLTTGFNRHLGWSHTVNYPDLEEIYELELDPERDDHVLFDGEAMPLERDVVKVEVKQEDGVEIVERSFWHSPLGPVIHRTADRAWVLKNAVYDEYRSLQQWYRMGQAESLEEFRQVLATQALPMFNIVYADREGNIFYLWNGRVPDLPHPAHRGEAVPARTSAEVWSRIHPLEELPQLLNPPGGYLHNANDPPYFTTLHQPLAIDDFPPHFPRHRLGLRSQHGLALLHDDAKHSLEDVRDLKFSLRMLLAERVKADLVAAAESSAPDEAVADAIELLRSWDGSVAAESRGSVLFEVWWQRYTRDGESTRPPQEVFAVPWTPDEPMATPRGLADPQRAVEALVWGVAETERRYGEVDVAWGEVHRLRQTGVDLPVGGCTGALGCYRVLSFREEEDGKRRITSGDSWIFLVEFAETPRAYTVVGYSNSGVTESPHYSDQAELFSRNQMKRAAFTDEEIAEQLVAAYRPGDEG